jgi:hypothetical protein
MAYKRRRDRWRKRPRPSTRHRKSPAPHSGPFMNVPRSSGGGSTMHVSSSGELQENEPISPWRWLALIPVGIAISAFIVISLITDLFLVPWIALGVFLVVLIYKTWRR